MKLTTIPRIKRVSLARPRLRRPRISSRKVPYLLQGGPLNMAWLCSPGTLRFSYQHWRGYYDQSNKWVSL
ncbi:hypothetical protein DK254_08385 [Pseudomonas sp. RW407]|nr:hypothetical protein DK254_08385 [Pseudomonas sp. RW407]